MIDEKTENINSYPNIIESVKLLFFYFIINLLVGLLSRLIFKQLGISDYYVTFIFILFSNSLLILFVQKKTKQKWKTLLQFFPFSYNIIVPTLLFLSGLALFIIEVDVILRKIIPPPEFINNLMAEFSILTPTSVLFIVIVVPITEEVIFRGIILKGLSCHCSSIKAILYSSILFSLFHLNPYQFISSFLGGLFLGHLYLKTNSIIPSIIAHAFFNLFSIVYVNFIYEFIQIPLQSFWLSLTGISLMFTGFLSLFKVLSNLNWSNSTGHLNKR